MRKLTIGKIRGLQQMSTAEGFFTISAIDHRGSLMAMINNENPDVVDYRTMVEYKIDLCLALVPLSSAILLDPVYGAPQAIARNVLPGHKGLLVSLEASGYEAKGDGRLTKLQQGWSVAKIKKMGASAAKLLLYFRPDLTETAFGQTELARKVARDCQDNDMPFLVETVSYTIKGEKGDSPQFAARKLGMVVDAARRISELNIDVFKAEFPGDLRYERDEGKLVELCRQVDRASPNPWVLLSAGVDYETYAKQVELACRGGASGFAAGRAIWQDAMTIQDRRDRVRSLATVAADRLKRLNDIVAKFAVPWHRKLNLDHTRLAEIPEDWYRNY